MDMGGLVSSGTQDQLDVFFVDYCNTHLSSGLCDKVNLSKFKVTKRSK